MRSGVTINKLWWEHLAPKPMISRRREVEQLLNTFISTSPYGAEWIKVAKNPNGIFRLKTGQVIPVIHLTFLGKTPGFVASFKKIEPGHRNVGVETGYKSGKRLENEEIVIQPIISIELVTDPLFIQTARQKNNRRKSDNSTELALFYSCTLSAVIEAFSQKSICALSAYFWGRGLVSE